MKHCYTLTYLYAHHAAGTNRVECYDTRKEALNELFESLLNSTRHSVNEEGDVIDTNNNNQIVLSNQREQMPDRYAYDMGDYTIILSKI